MNSTIRELPEIFESFDELRRENFIKAMEYKNSGHPLVGIFCTYLPIELPLAAGAAVVSLCAVSDETIAAAEEDLPRNLCPLIKASYGFGKTDKCPYFYFSDLVVGENTCDGKKKMYEFLAEFKQVYVVDLPNKQSEDGLALWKKEIYRFKEELERQFGVEITEEKLRNAVALRNRERHALIRFFETMKLDPPPMTGLDCYKVLNSASYSFDREAFAAEVEDLTEKVMERGSLPRHKPRILVTGSPMGGVYQKILGTLEENAYVVAFENCSGAKQFYGVADENAADIVEELASFYLNIGCACMSPNPNRLTLLRRMIKEYQVDGVVEVLLQYCNTYAVESRSIRRLVNEEFGLPYIAVETDYSTADDGQLSTRLNAFVEML
ncbi:MAG: double-cubane-cluster-containing anaerobic reductase [Eubacteriales bacterium]